MSLLANFPHTVDIKRPTAVQDDYGGEREGTPVSIQTGKSAWVQNASRKDITEFEKRDILISHNVFFTTGYDLRPDDYIEVTAGPSFVGLRLDYVADSDRSAGLGKLFGVICNEENNLRKSSFA